jgi:hypothetical protein
VPRAAPFAIRTGRKPIPEKRNARQYGDIPNAITGLINDPYRSLAGALRRAGGYAKDATPFSEFLWADFMRRRIKRSVVEKKFQRSLKTALAAAKTPEARYLPGWCGPFGEE